MQYDSGNWPESQIRCTCHCCRPAHVHVSRREARGIVDLLPARLFLFPISSWRRPAIIKMYLGLANASGSHTSIDIHSSHVMDCSSVLRLLRRDGPYSVSFQGGPTWARSYTWAIWPTP